MAPNRSALAPRTAAQLAPDQPSAAGRRLRLDGDDPPVASPRTLPRGPLGQPPPSGRELRQQPAGPAPPPPAPHLAADARERPVLAGGAATCPARPRPSRRHRPRRRGLTPTSGTAARAPRIPRAAPLHGASLSAQESGSRPRGGGAAPTGGAPGGVHRAGVGREGGRAVRATAARPGGRERRGRRLRRLPQGHLALPGRSGHPAGALAARGALRELGDRGRPRTAARRRRRPDGGTDAG